MILLIQIFFLSLSHQGSANQKAADNMRGVSSMLRGSHSSGPRPW